jgi:hypothetical protein
VSQIDGVPKCETTSVVSTQYTDSTLYT